MANGENGATGRNAPTPAKAPRETGVLAANVTATARHPRTVASDVWDTVTKSPTAPDTADGRNGRPGRLVLKLAAWPSKPADVPAEIPSRPLAADFASVTIAMKFTVRAIHLAQSKAYRPSTANGLIGVTGASARHPAAEDSGRDCVAATVRHRNTAGTNVRVAESSTRFATFTLVRKPRKSQRGHLGCWPTIRMSAGSSADSVSPVKRRSTRLC